MSYQPLTDHQWNQLEPLFPKQEKRGRGKPHTPWRAVVNSILWVLKTGGKWDTLPKDPAFASKSAAHRWYVEWEKSGLLQRILEICKPFLGPVEIAHPKRRNRKPREKHLPPEPGEAISQ